MLELESRHLLETLDEAYQVRTFVLTEDKSVQMIWYEAECQKPEAKTIGGRSQFFHTSTG
jgi:hypothetical protein